MRNPPTTVTIAGPIRVSYVIARRLANKRAAVALARVVVLLACLARLASAAPAPQVRIQTAEGRSVSVTVELAKTPAQHTRGLMFRQHLDSHHGMLFLFPKERDRTFWMKNTPLSLDILFIDSQFRIVGIQANTVPYSERQLSVGQGSRYVLEVKAGFCEREGVRVGDSIELIGIDG